MGHTIRFAMRFNMDGQTLIEYAMIIMFIAILIILSLVAFRVQVSTIFSTIVSYLAS